ncbi:MAG: hypothetical protein Q9190_005674 [Brigantiaea leucoxantha]
MVGGIILSFGFFYNVAVAIKVTPNSPCVRFCLDGGDLKNASQSNTEREDLVCDDSDVDAKGGKFKDCMECESQSNLLKAPSAMLMDAQSISNLEVLKAACYQRPFFGGSTPVQLDFPLFSEIISNTEETALSLALMTSQSTNIDPDTLYSTSDTIPTLKNKKTTPIVNPLGTDLIASLSISDSLHITPVLKTKTMLQINPSHITGLRTSPKASGTLYRLPTLTAKKSPSPSEVGLGTGLAIPLLVLGLVSFLVFQRLRAREKARKEELRESQSQLTRAVHTLQTEQNNKQWELDGDRTVGPEMGDAHLAHEMTGRGLAYEIMGERVTDEISA